MGDLAANSIQYPAANHIGDPIGNATGICEKQRLQKSLNGVKGIVNGSLGDDGRAIFFISTALRGI